ncbi:hypothetical protein [uncultured Gammaproteobacteria bacterium]|jgi:hypothetical protein|uniref:hypothetical protein n=1 Tax=thiotrophic endosymbiont of Bathymodiolus puteoserpentis (Logatchev) TaxID=343240 RepID=UPI0010B16965|nr:hypothetical protein [thiotrophic endosymbiont of Bathymodiolus puteoserpentis (Logatchev)]CAC9643121.1 hypothetical protein [uncultured Gammaproteobacteria bacterium]CAC9651890.1 hypothetical protein [uncultured Gammaproteobacteria bacterium]CAC9657056.1 hypothetical protein [uncultured Gammaproteobacteria bacterium]CAC9659312.1 hypothetical protein [uncultured Gammaproteobacteria bacterium]SSC09497.1 hypothetical protein BPUTEOSOX_1377 [thiotrophic endosymbiont of Bathymodiolus puteoserpe
MNRENINKKLTNVQVIDFREHLKASEKYVDVEIISADDFVWKGSIPYYYRRTGLFIETESDLIAYLKK